MTTLDLFPVIPSHLISFYFQNMSSLYTQTVPARLTATCGQLKQTPHESGTFEDAERLRQCL